MRGRRSGRSLALLVLLSVLATGCAQVKKAASELGKLGSLRTEIQKAVGVAPQISLQYMNGRKILVITITNAETRGKEETAHKIATVVARAFPVKVDRLDVVFARRVGVGVTFSRAEAVSFGREELYGAKH